MLSIYFKYEKNTHRGENPFVSLIKAIIYIFNFLNHYLNLG